MFKNEEPSYYRCETLKNGKKKTKKDDLILKIRNEKESKDSFFIFY